MLCLYCNMKLNLWAKLRHKQRFILTNVYDIIISDQKCTFLLNVIGELLYIKIDVYKCAVNTYFILYNVIIGIINTRRAWDH